MPTTSSGSSRHGGTLKSFPLAERWPNRARKPARSARSAARSSRSATAAAPRAAKIVPRGFRQTLDRATERRQLDVRIPREPVSAVRRRVRGVRVDAHGRQLALERAVVREHRQRHHDVRVGRPAGERRQRFHARQQGGSVEPLRRRSPASAPWSRPRRPGDLARAPTAPGAGSGRRPWRPAGAGAGRCRRAGPEARGLGALGQAEQQLQGVARHAQGLEHAADASSCRSRRGTRTTGPGPRARTSSGPTSSSRTSIQAAFTIGMLTDHTSGLIDARAAPRARSGSSRSGGPSSPVIGRTCSHHSRRPVVGPLEVDRVHRMPSPGATRLARPRPRSP